MKPRKFLSPKVSSIEEHKLSNKKENFVKICKYNFFFFYLRRSKYLILPFVLESGFSITKSSQVLRLAFHGHKSSFFLVPDLIFTWPPPTTLELFFSENPKKIQIEATEVF